MSTYTPPTIGLLGGGQLGKMLIRETMELDIRVKVLDPDPSAPCKHYAHEFVCGSFRDFDTVMAFADGVDLLTIEIEDVHVGALKALSQRGVKVVPDPDVLSIIRDKGLQKNFYRDNQLPSPDYFLLEGKQDLTQMPWEEGGFVQKLRTGGYDGKGVQIIWTMKEWEQRGWDAPSVIERCVSIRKEISVLVVRSLGITRAYDPVEMVVHQQGNLLDYLLSPASIDDSVRKEAIDLAMQCANAFHSDGLLAVELFLDTNNRVWINEVAPRSHNSGHGTIEAAATSQFAQHARIVAGLPPGDCTLKSPYAMINLLGPASYSGKPRYQRLEEVMNLPGVYVHLYGKEEMRPLRKMGHITILADKVSDVQARVEKIKSLLA